MLESVSEDSSESASDEASDDSEKRCEVDFAASWVVERELDEEVRWLFDASCGLSVREDRSSRRLSVAEPLGPRKSPYNPRGL